MGKVKFSWGNYFKNTPSNLQYFSISLKTIVASIGGTTLIMEANKWVVFSILLLGFVLDETIKFLGRVVEDDAKETVTVEYPQDMADQVTITKE